MALAGTNKPHAVCIAYPAQSHIKGILKLAKLLHHKGFYITFVNTDFNQKRFLKAGDPDRLNNLPDFQFKTIPDGLPPSNPDATQDFLALCGSLRRSFLSPFRDLLRHLNDTSYSNCPPVTCIVSDGTLSFATTVAKELGIPIGVFWTFSACAFMVFSQCRAFLERGLMPVKDESCLTNEYLDTVIDWIPGVKDIRVKDLPGFLRTTDKDDESFHLTMEGAEASFEASVFGLHTFDALEKDVLDALSSKFPHIYTIGPLELLLNEISGEDELESLGYNLWKEEPECLTWLDSKKSGSVVYVNFGSVTVMSKKQLEEFAWGLANSKCYFLWIIRPDLVIGETAILPPEFEIEAKERGFIASWCPQEQVLNHPSVGGFLTHTGWNSIIESLSAGVPMICWPFLGDQHLNCRLLCTKLEVGSEIDNKVKRSEVEGLVRELMGGEKGKKMKDKAMEWKEKAEVAICPNGSSSLNLDKLVNVLLSQSKNSQM